MANNSNSNSLVSVGLGLADLSLLELAKSNEKLLMYITNQLYSFSMPYKGQLKVKQSVLRKHPNNLFYANVVIEFVPRSLLQVFSHLC